MQLVCKCLGGSHSYGLSTPDSDIDYRGVFLNTNYRQILQLETENHVKERTDDIIYYELRRFVELLRNGNTTALEILFNKNWIEIDKLFEVRFCIAERVTKFLDSEKIYKCLKGYTQNELKLAMGLRPGTIGAKRANQVKKYGFSPKNFTQLLRLLLVGKYFFNTGTFIVNCKEFSQQEFELLYNVKTQPEQYTCDQLRYMVTTFEFLMDEAFRNRAKSFKFDDDYVSEAILKSYMPSLHEQYERICLK